MRTFTCLSTFLYDCEYSKECTITAPEYPIRTRIFSKIRDDIREWMFISGVNDTGEKREKFWDIIFLNILLRA